jgi:hypothetical protein
MAERKGKESEGKKSRCKGGGPIVDRFTEAREDHFPYESSR